MKNYSLKPTDENAVGLLRQNTIGRNDDIFNFVRLLMHMKDDCYSVAVNGEWGSGKTFFVKQVKLILDAANPQSDMSEQKREGILRLIDGKVDCAEPYATVYYDAWSYDDHDDPILSLVYAALQSGQGDELGRKGGGLLNAAAGVFDAIEGTKVSTIVQSLKNLRGEDNLATIKGMESLKGRIREFIDSLITEKGNRLVIFVDELDRCKPDYTIRFLERVKHYFDDDRLTFVFSINLSQLQWTVKNYYGSGFNASRYLDKFFDIRTTLPRADYRRFLQERLSFQDNCISEVVCYEVIRQFEFSLREIERYIRLIRIAEDAIKNWTATWPEQKARTFAANYIVPILIGLQMYDLVDYQNFLAGSDPCKMIDILMSANVVQHCQFFFERGEQLDDQTNEIVDRVGDRRKVEDRLKKIYTAIFGKTDFYDNEGVMIGEMRFTKQTRYVVERIAAMLFPTARVDF